MNIHTIRQLNQLNNNFYTTIATSFDQTRSHPWDGWKEIPTVFSQNLKKKSVVTVLDIGCGNGRLGEYLTQSIITPRIKYIGVDSNEELLTSSQKKLQKINVDFSLYQKDFIEEMLINSQHAIVTDHENQECFDIIAVFGVMHHVPSFRLRKEIIEWCYKHLQPGGILLLSFWYFHQSKQFKRQILPELVAEKGIDLADLELHDYFLDWQRGKSAIRYCHLISSEEEQELISNERWNYLKVFTADVSNHYVFLQKK